MNVDRAKMNANVLKALKPGGKFIIVDHSGRAGTGSSEVKTLHRVDEASVRDDSRMRASDSRPTPTSCATRTTSAIGTRHRWPPATSAERATASYSGS